MKKTLLALVVTNTLIITGCSTVPVESNSKSAALKSFSAPTQGRSNIYIYRTNSILGAALKKDIWVDNECIGESARGIFFYHEVQGNKKHSISTESEFSPNSLVIDMKPGSSYFIEQYMKPGLFVGGANLKQVSTEEGKKEVSLLSLAKKGNCSSK